MNQVYNYSNICSLNFPFSIFLHYLVTVEKSDESPRILKSDTNENFIVSGLVDSTTYSISVKVACTKGESLPSQPITVLTGTFEPNDKDLLLDLQKKLVSNEKKIIDTQYVCFILLPRQNHFFQGQSQNCPGKKSFILSDKHFSTFYEQT